MTKFRFLSCSFLNQAIMNRIVSSQTLVSQSDASFFVLHQFFWLKMSVPT